MKVGELDTMKVGGLDGMKLRGLDGTRGGASMGPRRECVCVGGASAG